MTTKAKPKRWSYAVGRKPHRFTVYEREPGGLLCCRAWDPTLRGGRGDFAVRALGHRDRDAAMTYAAEQHAKLVRGEVTVGHVTLGQLLAQYDQHAVSRKRPAEQQAARRRAELFVRALGAEKDPLKITRAEWQRLIDDRRSGAIDARGRRVAADRRRQPRDRTVEADLKGMLAVLNWATTWQDRAGRYLLRENPCRGLDFRKAIPRERNPRRPIMTTERYLALLSVADRVTFEVMRRETSEDGKRRRKRTPVPSYLPELLVLANETGRRLGSIIGLTYEDVHTERTLNAPNGAITWRADLDKKGKAWPHVAITAACRAALDGVLRERPGIGAAPLFPAPKDPTRPVDRHLVDRWLRRAEKLAGLDPQDGSLWHAFRRKAATELKGAADKDVMALLGWSDVTSLKAAYQHADPEGMLAALESRRELRERAW